MNLNIKLIALDLDGTTLLDDHCSISERTKHAIEDAISRSIPVIPTTGRPYTYLPSSVTLLNGMDYVVTSNGAVVYSLKKQAPICGKYITSENAARILRRIPEGIYAEIWRSGSIYFSSRIYPDDYPLNLQHLEVLRTIGAKVLDLITFTEFGSNEIDKINLPFVPPALKPEIRRLLADLPDCSLLDTGEGFEIMNADVTKAFGLRNLCRYFQRNAVTVSLENILAVGDSTNDVEMLHSCGIGVAMGNADDAIKRAADFITLRNTEDGAALAIEKYALSKNF